MFEKRTFFEDSVRVPLVVCDPRRREAQRISDTVSLVDLFPSFVDWSESDWPGDALDGESLVSLLDGQGAEQRSIVTEYYGESIKSPFRAVVRGDLKYVHFPEEEADNMLLDLTKEEGAHANLINDLNYTEAARELGVRARAGFDYEAFRKQIDQSILDRKLLLRGILDKNERPWRHFPAIEDVMWHWLPKK